MNLARLLCVVVALTAMTSQVYAVTLTFDDIPQGMGLEYYGIDSYGINFDWGFLVADHTGSTWGPPQSGSNVLAWSYPGTGRTSRGMGFKKAPPEGGPAQLLYAYSVGGYFSTEPGVVLQMVGYHSSWYDPPVALATIGAPEQAWNNVYVEIGSASGINLVEFKPVTTDALAHFCADDIDVNFVPEPASLLALCVGLVPLMVRRRRG